MQNTGRAGQRTAQEKGLDKDFVHVNTQQASCTLAEGYRPHRLPGFGAEDVEAQPGHQQQTEAKDNDLQQGDGYGTQRVHFIGERFKRKAALLCTKNRLDVCLWMHYRVIII